MTGADLSALRLPPLLRTIAEVASLEAALKLSKERGGTRMYVPHKLSAGHWLVELIGVDAAAAVQKLYAGDVVDIPLGLGGSAQTARAIARHALDGGASVAQAARQAGLTERGVYKLLSREERRRSSMQLNLFDE